MRLRFLLIFCLFAFVTSVYPQAKRPIYSISGGVALPSLPKGLNEYWNGGWHISGGIGYPVTRYLTIGGTISYSHLPFDAERVIAHYGTLFRWISVDGVSATIVTSNCRLKINLVPPDKTTRFSPYFFGGLGWFRLTEGEYVIQYKYVWNQSGGTNRQSKYTTSQFGLEFGSGIEICLTKRLNAYAEIACSTSFSYSPIWAEWVPIRIGLLLH